MSGVDVPTCPGGCGAQAGGDVVACLSCWRRLPLDLRRAVQAAADARQWPELDALHGEAAAWLRAHPVRRSPATAAVHASINRPAR